MRWRGWLASALASLLLLIPEPVVLADDWITKGGSPQRMSTVSDAQGLIELVPYWETQPLGESAAQPVV
ncbi:MAG: hypothetical protein CW346_20830, partial [Bacillaceae bacterium]|nr:hypothetical protein [Bacillaceae bacterium]